jgi:hypothetical protein
MRSKYYLDFQIPRRDRHLSVTGVFLLERGQIIENELWDVKIFDDPEEEPLEISEIER